MNITLRQLQVFLAITQTRSITAAAERLHLTKPAVSAALSELEKRIGNPLFDRSGNRLHLNDLGQKLLPLADELLQRSRDIEVLFSTEEVQRTSLRLGASFTVGQQLIPWLLRDYRLDHLQPLPKVHISNTREICQQLIAFELDIGLIEGEVEDPEIETLTWMQDRMLILANPEHPLAGIERSSQEALEDQPWVLREPGSGSRNLFLHRVAPHLQRWRIALELNSTEAIINATAAGLGLSCLSELEAQYAIKSGRLVAIEVDLNLTRTFRLAWHREKYLSPALLQFVHYCQAWNGVVNRA